LRKRRKTSASYLDPEPYGSFIRTGKMTIALNALSRRAALGLVAPAALLAATGAESADSAADGRPADADLASLTRRLASAPRRRSFKSVPFVVVEKGFWDHEAADALLAYRNPSRQMWECTDLAAPWLNLMREAVNGQVFAHGNPGFLAVAAVHGSAHLALFDDHAWETYGLARLAGGAPVSNTFFAANPKMSRSDDLQNLKGYYGPDNNNIATMQERGMAFVACHDSIHAIARNVRHLDQGTIAGADALAAELTNHLIPGAVLVPSVVAFLAELQRVGFTYAKGA